MQNITIYDHRALNVASDPKTYPDRQSSTVESAHRIAGQHTVRFRFNHSTEYGADAYVELFSGQSWPTLVHLDKTLLNEAFPRKTQVETAAIDALRTRMLEDAAKVLVLPFTSEGNHTGP